MKKKKLLLLMLASPFMLWSCSDDDSPPVAEEFTVTIENVQSSFAYLSSGVFDTPVGSSSPGGAGPGNSYEFTVYAGPGNKLSFATMFVSSNDLFFGPDGDGIDLFNGNTQITGDITSQITLWDAGTEVNEMPGDGPNQPMNQSGPDTGTDENGMVRDIGDVDDGFTYPSVANTIKVTLTAGSSVNEFVVKIENLSGSTSPIAPGVWVIHTDPDPLFTEGSDDLGLGLEGLAEDGDPENLASDLESNAGLNTPFAPGVWALHSGGMPMYTSGSSSSAGLEALAEDGDPAGLAAMLTEIAEVRIGAAFNTPSGASSPAPILPGESYVFTFTANPGDYLSLATMFVQSNDLFYGFSEDGIALWNGDSPISGDLTSELYLWDAGTEVNEYPGVGLNQAPRQSGPDTGDTENGTVVFVDDDFTYTSVESNIKITISSN